ncbi:MAG: hypothetical protein LBS52_05950 [Dysgonamonadaceae bacterium]|jgi:TPR repeat protein|nr:hypothetical protein [Dysgonamonadaceae bacterium]
MKKILIASFLFAHFGFPLFIRAQQTSNDEQILSKLKKAQAQIDAKKPDKAAILLNEAYEYFRTNYRDTGVVFILSMYCNQKLLYAVGAADKKAADLYNKIHSRSPKLEDQTDAKKNMIVAYNNLLRESSVKLKYPAYNLMEAKLFLLKAKQKMPIQATPEEQEALDLCGFDFSMEHIDKSLQTIEKRLPEFNNEELCKVSENSNVTVGYNLYELAAKNGSVKGSVFAGYCAENGIGCPKNYEKARHYYQVATDAGDVKGACFLAALYFYGKGVEQDKQKAAQILTPIEGKEEFDKWGGSYIMANLYETGTGVMKNKDKALMYYMEAAENHFSKKEKEDAYEQYKKIMQENENKSLEESLKDKDISHFTGKELQEIALNYEYYGNMESAKKYFHLAAGKKDGFSCNHLGILYSSDKSANLSKQATECFKLGAEAGYGPAIYNYARALYYGIGVYPDIDAANGYAEQYFQIVENGKHTDFQKKELLTVYSGPYKEDALLKGAALHDAYTNIEKELLSTGFSNRQDNTAHALYYYERARAKGSKKATSNIGNIYQYGTNSIKPDYEKAYKYYTEAIPYEWAYYGLGEMYEKGQGVKEDREKALEYYRLAEKTGDNYIKQAVSKKLKTLGEDHLQK